MKCCIYTDKEIVKKKFCVHFNKWKRTVCVKNNNSDVYMQTVINYTYFCYREKSGRYGISLTIFNCLYIYFDSQYFEFFHSKSRLSPFIFAKILTNELKLNIYKLVSFDHDNIWVRNFIQKSLPCTNHL